jgi:hypothetical protein
MAVALLAALGLAITGCTDARLVNVWQDPSLAGRKLHTVMVVSRESDPTTRRLAEDAVTARMRKGGIEAVPSYEVFPDAQPASNDVQNALLDRNLDAALVLKPMEATTESHWVPGWTSTQVRTFYDPWAAREVTVYRDRYHPGYHETETYARQQVTLWTGGNDHKMVWAGTVIVPSRGPGEVVVNDIAGGVVPAMKRAGLI